MTTSWTEMWTDSGENFVRSAPLWCRTATSAHYTSASVDLRSILQSVPRDSSRDRLCAHIKLTFDGGTEFSICVVRLEARLDSRRMNGLRRRRRVESLTSTETMPHALHTHTLSICYITWIAIAPFSGRLPNPHIRRFIG